jgi:hypothetical protein
MGSGSDIQIIVGGREVELFQENVVLCIGIMLFGMEFREFKPLIGPSPDNLRHFDIFRAHANYDENHVNLCKSEITIFAFPSLGQIPIFLLFLFLYCASVVNFYQHCHVNVAGTYIYER